MDSLVVQLWLKLRQAPLVKWFDTFSNEVV